MFNKIVLPFLLLMSMNSLANAGQIYEAWENDADFCLKIARENFFKGLGYSFPMEKVEVEVTDPDLEISGGSVYDKIFFRTAE